MTCPAQRPARLAMRPKRLRCRGVCVCVCVFVHKGNYVDLYVILNYVVTYAIYVNINYVFCIKKSAPKKVAWQVHTPSKAGRVLFCVAFAV